MGNNANGKSTLKLVPLVWYSVIRVTLDERQKFEWHNGFKGRIAQPLERERCLTPWRRCPNMTSKRNRPRNTILFHNYTSLLFLTLINKHVVIFIRILLYFVLSNKCSNNKMEKIVEKCYVQKYEQREQVESKLGNL